MAEAATPHIDFNLNELGPGMLGHHSEGRWLTGDLDNDMFLEPPVVEQIGGYPLYASDHLALMRSGESIWAPVPVERFMKVWLARRQGQVALPGAAQAQWAALISPIR